MKKLFVISLITIHYSLFTLLTPCMAQTFAEYHFDSLSSGMTSPGAYVLALAMKDSSQNSHLYAGGHFTVAGRMSSINVAEWKDTLFSFPTILGEWTPLGSGVNNDVCALAMCNQYLYAGGKFDTAGSVACSHIARWDTAALQWDTLLGSLNGNVYALCVYNGNLYPGGDFTIAGGDTVNRIAVWNDSIWSPVGNGFDTGAVYALAVSNDTLYAGGSFIKSNGLVVNHIAKWNGTFWDSVRGGTNNTVYALANEYGLYVGGAFTKSGNIRTNYISVFYNYKFGQTWDSVGSGTNDTVRALNIGWGGIANVPVKMQPEQGIGGGNVIIIGGNFDSAGGYRSQYIAGWMGTWDTIGELNGPVFALANPYNAWDGENYVGGRFNFSDYFGTIDTLNNIAYLNIFLGGGVPSLTIESAVNVYPNPTSGKFSMEVKNEKQKVKNIEIYNALGQRVYSKSFTADSQLFTFHVSLSTDLSDGIYLYRVIDENGGLIGEGKVIIQK